MGGQKGWEGQSEGGGRRRIPFLQHGVRVGGKLQLVEECVHTCTLLRLDQTRCAVNADNQAASDFGVKGAAVTGLFDAQDPPEPCDNFVGGRI